MKKLLERLRTKDGNTWIIFCLVVFLIGCVSCKILGPDNPVEEVVEILAENIIELETGEKYKVDFSPEEGQHVLTRLAPLDGSELERRYVTKSKVTGKRQAIRKKKTVQKDEVEKVESACA